MFRAIGIMAILSALLFVPLQAQGATMDITMTIRDFCDDHPDFENGLGDDRGFVDCTIGSDGKPVYVGGAGTTTTHGAANFNQWYNDTPGVNMTTTKTLTATNTSADPDVYTYTNTAFFPIDGELFGNEGRAHNYHFTAEFHVEFAYETGQVFHFTGDDDVFVFINGELVIDLGGVHVAESASVDLDTLGLTPGLQYDFDFFYAERHTTLSDLIFETNIPIPEPATLSVVGLGGLAVLLKRRRRRSS